MKGCENTRKMSFYKNYVCPLCWRQLPECTCEFIPWSLIQIDEGIQEHIRLLNEKGYYTSACCEGHYDSDVGIHIYITFRIPPNYDTPLPEGIVCDKYHAIRCSIYKNKNKRYTQEEAEAIKEQKLVELLKWIQSLPNYGGQKK